MRHGKAFKISESYFGWDIKLFTEGFGKIFIQSKKNYILEKILSQKTTFFSIFVPKITVSDIKKIGVFGIFPKFSVKSH